MVRAKYLIFFVMLFIVNQHQSSFAADLQKTGGKSQMSDYNGPQDTPREWGSEIERMRQPYIEKAKKTYPNAKARFQTGLPNGYRFFVTIDLQEKNIQENAFMAVQSISGGKITATIATKLQQIKSHQYGEGLVFPESMVLDWTITSPGGKEEGNFIGKFLDEYYRTHP